MKTLNLEQVLELHVLAANIGNGSAGIRDLGRLEAAIATQTQSVYGQDLYEGHFMKSAALIRSIILDHPFVDANKRTGILVGLVFLEENDVKLQYKEGEIADFAVAVATKKYQVKKIAEWLREHSV